jgi:hypothetical protein
MIAEAKGMTRTKFEESWCATSTAPREMIKVIHMPEQKDLSRACTGLH